VGAPQQREQQGRGPAQLLAVAGGDGDEHGISIARRGVAWVATGGWLQGNESCSLRERCCSVRRAWPECRAKNKGRNLDTHARYPACTPAWRAVSSLARGTRRRSSQRGQP